MNTHSPALVLALTHLYSFSCLYVGNFISPYLLLDRRLALRVSLSYFAKRSELFLLVTESCQTGCHCCPRSATVSRVHRVTRTRQNLELGHFDSPFCGRLVTVAAMIRCTRLKRPYECRTENSCECERQDTSSVRCIIRTVRAQIQTHRYTVTGYLSGHFDA